LVRFHHAEHAEARDGDRHCRRAEKAPAVMIDGLNHVISPLGIAGVDEVAGFHTRAHP
jgi:hypothetical protein